MKWKPCTAGAYQETELPSARMGHIAVVVDARRSWGEELLVVHGGLNIDKQSLGDLAVLQVDSEAWFHPRTTNAGPPSRVFHSAAAEGSYLYVFGGHAFHKEGRGVHKYNDLWRLNTDNWEWLEVCPPESNPSPGSQQPCNRDFAGMVALPGQRLLVFGGLDMNAKRLDDLWIFDCSTSRWSELVLPTRPKARFGFSLARLEQGVLLFGGENAAGALMNDVWLLKGVAGGEEQPHWQQLEVPGEAPSPRKAHAMAALGRHLVVFGGHTSEAGWFRNRTVIYHNDTTVLDRQATLQWQAPAVDGEPPAPREFHTLTQLSSTRLLLFGGGDGKNIFSDTMYLCLEDEAAAPQGRSLMDEGHHPEDRRAPARTLSVMSELSDQQLLTRNDIATATVPRPPPAGGTDLMPLPNPQPMGHTATAPDLPAIPLAENVGPSLLVLRERLGIGASEVVDSEGGGRKAFQQLGLATTASATPFADPYLLRDAARAYLVGHKAQELALRDIAALLWDLQDSRTLQLGSHIDSLSELEAALQKRVSDPSYKFHHLQAKDLRIGDIESLHASYAQFVSQQGAR